MSRTLRDRARHRHAAAPDCSSARTGGRRQRGISATFESRCTSKRSSRFSAPTPRGPGARHLAAGMEHLPAGLARVQLRVKGAIHETPSRFAAGCAALPALRDVAARLFAAPVSGPRFLLVFLRGGYDCTNLLIPYSAISITRSRPNIAIARPDPAATTARSALDADWALAPALRDRSARCISSGRRPSSPSPAPTIYRAAISKPRTASSWGNPRRRTRLPLRVSRPFGGGARGHRAEAADRLHRRAAASSQGGARCRICRCKASASRASTSARRRFSRDMYAGHRLRASGDATVSTAQEVAQEMQRRNGSGQPRRHQYQGLRAAKRERMAG